jgi:hypothetical protein
LPRALHLKAFNHLPEEAQTGGEEETAEHLRHDRIRRLDRIVQHQTLIISAHITCRKGEITNVQHHRAVGFPKLTQTR